MTSPSKMDYCPVNVRWADWGKDPSVVLAGRSAFLPALQHEQPFDASSVHYIARINESLAGYLCIDHDGHIALAATTDDHAVDIIDALLRFAVMDTPKRGLSQLSAPVSHPWHEALQRLYFSTEHSKDKNMLVRFLPPDRTANATGSSLVRLEKLDDFRSFAVSLARQARRSIIIFSEDLEGWLYDNDEFTAALMELAQKSRNSSVRLLIRDSRQLLLHGHRLLRASHRASDKITLRKLPSIQSEKHPCFMIVDDNGLLFRQDPQVLQGIGYTDYRARAKPLLEQFEQLWARSGTDPDLRQHTV